MTDALRPYFEQIPGRDEWIISGLGNGTIRCTNQVARQLVIASREGRLFPYEVVEFQEIVDADTCGSYYDLTITKTYNTKMWGYAR